MTRPLAPDRTEHIARPNEEEENGHRTRTRRRSARRDPAATAHHGCRGVAGGFLECLVYASDAPDAPLAAVELVVEPATYRGFDPAEQRLWHPVEGNHGKLILLGDPASLGGPPTGQPRVRGAEPGTPTA